MQLWNGCKNWHEDLPGVASQLGSGRMVGCCASGCGCGFSRRMTTCVKALKAVSNGVSVEGVRGSVECQVLTVPACKG